MNADRRAAILDALARSLRIDRASLTIDTDAADVPAWDSLAHLLLFMALEDEFGVRFSSESIAGYTTVRSIVERIEQGGPA